ncbi:hypothetical protein TWF506_001269 [Arthrobotrys conoides]|uniref:Uncharacterized protein n=1 Tax=Arthrobotrys conoides TaxID=74498 RepID=A0AAN8P1S1_9PEZI
MSGFEIVGLILGAVGLVPLFKEGYVMAKEYRQRKKTQLLTLSGSTSSLEDTLEDGSTTIANRYDSLHSKYGSKFSNGDATSHAQLSKIIILLQGEIIATLRAALAEGTLENASHLRSIASQSRQEAISVLGQLAQRISTTIAPMLSDLVTNKKPKYLPNPRVQELDDTDNRPHQYGNYYPYGSSGYGSGAVTKSHNNFNPYATGSQAYPDDPPQRQYSGWRPVNQAQRSKAEAIRTSLKVLGFDMSGKKSYK